MTIADRHAATLDLTVDAQHPWPGLAAFREQDQPFYRGRRDETDELYRLTRRARLTVFFGPSGLGKTSLLQAGLFPRLRTERFLPLFLRIGYAPDSPEPRAQVRAALATAAREHHVEAPTLRDDDTLWERFHRENSGFWNARNEPITPVLVFDQFEELFTLGGRRADAFVGELADLIEGSTPEVVRARLDRQPKLLEEFFFDRHPYKVIISLREDFLAELEGLREQIPSIAHNRLRLRPLGGGQAMEVVRAGGSALVSDATAERIIRFVAGEHARPTDALEQLEIEPALLSLVCRELNQNRVQQGRTEITADLLEGTGKEILSRFYERSFQELHPRAVAQEARWFIEEKLITASGYRDSVALDNLPHSMSNGALAHLVNRRLLRMDERGGARRVELTHDVLTGVVREGRDRRRIREKSVKRRRQLAVAFVTLGTIAAVSTGLVLKYQKQNSQISKLTELIYNKNWVLVRRQLNAASENLAKRGLRRGDSLMGYISHGASWTSRVVLDSNASALVAVCDRECSNLDLLIRDSMGVLVGADTSIDDAPVVSIPSGRTGRVEVTVRMVDCKIDPCFYGALLFEKTAAVEEPPRVRKN